MFPDHGSSVTAQLRKIIKSSRLSDWVHGLSKEEEPAAGGTVVAGALSPPRKIMICMYVLFRRPNSHNTLSPANDVGNTNTRSTPPRISVRFAKNVALCSHESALRKGGGLQFSKSYVIRYHQHPTKYICTGTFMYWYIPVVSTRVI